MAILVVTNMISRTEQHTKTDRHTTKKVCVHRRAANSRVSNKRCQKNRVSSRCAIRVHACSMFR